MTDQTKYDVAIVGYGPVGVTAANLLGQMGLTVVVIERDPDIYARARAISTDEEVLRIWQQVGLADRLNADMQPGCGASFVDAKGEPFVKLYEEEREQTLMREIEELKKQIAAKAEDQVTRHSKMFVSSRHG